MRIKLFEEWILEGTKKSPEDRDLFKEIQIFLNTIESPAAVNISNKANAIYTEFDRLNAKQRYDAKEALKTSHYLKDVDLMVNPFLCALDLRYYSELPTYSYTKENRPKLTELPEDTVKVCVRWFVHAGISLEGACALVGNLWRESYLNPHQKQINGGPGRGLAQWSLDDRWSTYINNFFPKFKSSHTMLRNINQYHIEPQLAFVLYELKNDYRNVYNSLLSPGDLDGKTIKVLKEYEVARDKDKAEEQNTRIGLAKKAFAIASNDSKIPVISNIVQILKNADRNLFS
jgi:hypothetical protein